MAQDQEAMMSLKANTNKYPDLLTYKVLHTTTKEPWIFRLLMILTEPIPRLHRIVSRAMWVNHHEATFRSWSNGFKNKKKSGMLLLSDAWNTGVKRKPK